MSKKKDVVQQIIKKISHSLDKIPDNLDSYDICLIGNQMSNPLSKQISHFAHETKTLFITSHQPSGEYYAEDLRLFYEQRRLNLIKYSSLKEQVQCLSFGSCLNQGLKMIHPDKNEIVLKNGRVIKYKVLALEANYEPDYEKVKGLKECLLDEKYPVFSNFEFGVESKYYQFVPLF